jgi:adenylate cyclase class 2
MSMSETSPPTAGESTFEVEMKFRVNQPADLRRRIERLGPRLLDSDEQEDTYLAHPARDFAQTGEALRIRRVGRENRITYKGPKLAGPTKTREEIEIGFDPGDRALAGLERLWEALGFRPVATVRKRRTGFELIDSDRAVHVVIDETESLGTFAEVETLARGQADLSAAQETVQRVAAGLGLSSDMYEPRSYLRMLLESRKSPGPD